MGAIGFVSRIIPSVYPISIIRVDSVSGEPIRNSKGLCTVCKPGMYAYYMLLHYNIIKTLVIIKYFIVGEPGVFIGKIIPNNPSRAFLGYVDKEASQKKIVRDVFSKGDSAFLSGNLVTLFN